ncbi:MAG TPA: hypothetical protein VFT23_07470, partial [Burkholderiales bacterium]|nr:hypothetical protein [Burkholderiales bacterium]
IGERHAPVASELFLPAAQLGGLAQRSAVDLEGLSDAAAAAVGVEQHDVHGGKKHFERRLGAGLDPAR